MAPAGESATAVSVKRPALATEEWIVLPHPSLSSQVFGRKHVAATVADGSQTIQVAKLLKPNPIHGLHQNQVAFQ